MSRIDDDYLRLLVRALPDPAEAAHHLSATVTLVQTAMAALRDNEADNAKRAEVALTAVLAALTRLTKDFDRAAKWLASPGDVATAHYGGNEEGNLGNLRHSYT
jgi:hypothetical protein